MPFALYNGENSSLQRYSKIFACPLHMKEVRQSCASTAVLSMTDQTLRIFPPENS